jgi:hypothetical protein
MTTCDRELPGFWRRFAPACPAIAGALASILLLVAFEHVVRGGVQQGEARRKAVAMHTDAQWRCKGLPGARLRADCLLQLDPTFGGDEPLPAEHVRAIALQ